MSCNHTDPCKDPCNTDPCYDNCGCINPTTFECVTKPGNYHTLGVTNDMNGKQVLSAIDNKLAEVHDISGKVSIDHQDFCPNTLSNKLEAGPNISITQVGTGCDKKLVITGGVGIGPAGGDVNVKVSSTDTSTGFLNNKVDVGTFLTKAVIGGIGNQKLKLDVGPLSNFISTDSGNQIILGTDGRLKTAYTTPDGSETKIIGAGAVNVTGNGTNSNPYIIYSNPSISPKRITFTGQWLPLIPVPFGSVTFSNSTAQYRFRFDGTMEFRGRITASVTFPVGSNPTIDLNSVFTFPIGSNNPILNLTEISRESVIKNVTTFGAGSVFDIYSIYITSLGKLGLKFTYTGSTVTTAATRVVLVDFDSASYHLNIP
jgi:hypothetical protein